MSPDYRELHLSWGLVGIGGDHRLRIFKKAVAAYKTSIAERKQGGLEGAHQPGTENYFIPVF